MDLTNDIDEFKTVLPKSGHRLKIKKVVNQAKESDGGFGHFIKCRFDRQYHSEQRRARLGKFSLIS